MTWKGERKNGVATIKSMCLWHLATLQMLKNTSLNEEIQHTHLNVHKLAPACLWPQHLKPFLCKLTIYSVKEVA